MVGLRGILVSALGLVAIIVLARKLSPSEFGIASLGAVLARTAATLSEVGLGAGLIRRADPPSQVELTAMAGVQLTAATGLLVVVAAIGLPLGRIGAVAAGMLLLLPLLAFRTPGMILLERGLRYREVAQIETVEALVYVATLVPLVLLGLGLPGVVIASNARFAAGLAMVLVVMPAGVRRPSFQFAAVRPLVRFGLNYQAVDLASAARTQLLNIGTAAISGTTTLAVWSVAARLIQVPFLLFGALWRVSFPSMSILTARTPEVRWAVERAARLTAVGTAVLLVPLAAGSPALVPEVFGDAYEDAGTLMLPFCLALQFSGPVSVALGGLLFARGEAGTVLRATVINGLAWLGVGLSLLPIIGVLGLGLAFVLAAGAESFLFARAAFRLDRVRLFRPVGGPFARAVPSVLVGMSLGFALHDSAIAGVVAALLALICFAATQLALDRSTSRTILGLLGDLR